MQSPTVFVRIVAALVVALCCGLAPTVSAQVTPPPPPTPPPAAAPDGAASGAYTVEQALRGDSAFTQKCVSCHTRKDYSNPDFQLKWQGRTAFDLFEKIRSTMPDDSPGSLARDMYADLVAYLLKLNGMPTGSAPLPADSAALVNVKLELVPQTPPPSFSLLRHFTASFPRGR